jgi:hypothetical protein
MGMSNILILVFINLQTKDILVKVYGGTSMEEDKINLNILYLACTSWRIMLEFNQQFNLHH